MKTSTDAILTIVVTPNQLALLLKFDFPCSQDVLASAVRCEEGIELSGSRYDFESLVGWVAGEANHGRSRALARTALLDDIADQLEDAQNSTIDSDRNISSQPPPSAGEWSTSTIARSQVLTRTVPPLPGTSSAPPPMSGSRATGSPHFECVL